MKLDSTIMASLRCAQDQYGSAYSLAKAMGDAGDRSGIRQCFQHFAEWESGERSCQPQVGDEVWERFWVVLQQYLGPEYAPLSTRLAAPVMAEPGSRTSGLRKMFVVSQRWIDDATTEAVLNPDQLGTNDKSRWEPVDSTISFGFDVCGQSMEGNRILDGDAVLCGPALRTMHAVPGGYLAACKVAGRCLVRIFDRHGDQISLFCAHNSPPIQKLRISDIEWVAPVLDVKMNLGKGGLCLVVPRRWPLVPQ